jgi:signal transduction histidine kinase
MKAVAMMEEHRDRLVEFLAQDPKGSRIPAYLSQAAREVANDNETLQRELSGLQKSIDHIKEVIAMQQGYARIGGITEELDPRAMVEDAIRLNRDSMERHKIRIVREFQESQMVRTDKHKVLQILVNLIRNAKHACEDSEQEDPWIRFRVGGDGEVVYIEISDNGVGISAENLARIFQHGFTTKKQGHGFGLHSGILAAKELGGKLEARSEGVGRGALFRLELPIQIPSERERRAA